VTRELAQETLTCHSRSRIMVTVHSIPNLVFRPIKRAAFTRTQRSASKAGIHGHATRRWKVWMPAFAGMTESDSNKTLHALEN
jgi:hypothetical protein